MAMLKKSSIFGLLKNAFHMIFIYVKTHFAVCTLRGKTVAFCEF